MTETTTHTLDVDDTDDGARVDAWLATRLDESRSRLAELVKDGHVTVDGRRVSRASSRVRAGQTIVVAVPPPAPIEAIPQAIPLVIVYEDDDVIVVDKPAGMVVHPAPGHPDGTLVNALLHHCGGQLDVGGAMRPGIVHRIDKDTSGLIVCSRSDRAHQHLQAQFAAHTVEREYRALCAHTTGPALADDTRFETGHTRHPTDRKRFTGRHGGTRHAVTLVHVLERFERGAVLVACRLETGRTHQIRVHLSEAGHPLLGDALYGGRAAGGSSRIARQALHAATLGFEHPDGRTLRFEAPLPDDFEAALAALRRGAPWR